MSWVDCHAHLDFFGNDNHIDEIVDRAKDNGVQMIISIADTPQSSSKTVKIAKNYKNVFAAIGVHPHEASLFNEEVSDQLYKLAKDKNVCAIGEIGLDYYRESCQKSIQQDAFRAQLKIAKDLNLPVVIHNREADDDVLAILKEEDFPADKTILHCFSGGSDFAKQAMRQGFYVSLSGTITFKRSAELEETLLSVPDNKLLVETDSPFLAPAPHRGKTNEPAYVRIVGEHLSKIRGMEPDDMAKITRENVGNIFGV